MNGAQALVRTLADCGVDTCFSNPGTSEMHFVAALDAVPSVHGVLCLFEGVATGAADGYGRMAGRPAAALLHLGPGLANGLANLHNARRACTPLLAVVGDHATYHKRFDAPLESDIGALAGPVSGWVRRPARAADLAADAAEAVAAAMTPPGQVATLILPADVSWSEGGQPAAPLAVRAPEAVPDEVTGAAAAVLRSGEPCVILLGGTAVRREGLEAASRAAQAAGARLLCETFPARLERGAGIPVVERLAYLAEMAAAQLAGSRHLILAGARAPVSFFAYPGQPSSLVPGGCQVHVLAERGDDVCGALASLADLLAPGATPLPLAAGAAIACPDRPVLALEADGSAMYTISALWTHAREQLDITTIIFSNRSYAILGMELDRVGAASGGDAARSLLDLSRPGIDFAALAAGMGVPASRAATTADLAAQLRHALAEPGPHLIEAAVPPPW